MINTAIVYCEANFSSLDGKTANGLVRQSEKYKIIGIIDSKKAGLDSGIVLDGIANGIPIYSSLNQALDQLTERPEYFILGIAPAGGVLSINDRTATLQAIKYGLNIINGLHEFLSDDIELSTACLQANVEIIDIRKPPEKKDLRIFTGRINEVSCPCIAVLGTDCAIGKRTTASILTKALNNYGIRTVMISTGQTGLIQGAKYGVALDAIPSQFCIGELEATILEAFETENPDLIVIEGQGALSHPAFSTSAFILRGSCPDGVILQHAPNRSHRCDFENITMPIISEEVQLIETFAKTRVIGVTINHENMSDRQVNESITKYENQLKIPATDALTRPSSLLVDMVMSAFPDLNDKLAIKS